MISDLETYSSNLLVQAEDPIELQQKSPKQPTFLVTDETEEVVSDGRSGIQGSQTSINIVQPQTVVEDRPYEARPDDLVNEDLQRAGILKDPKYLSNPYDKGNIAKPTMLRPKTSQSAAKI